MCFDDVGCFFSFVLLLLREIFSYVGFGGVLVRLGKLLDLEKKVATAEPMIKSLSVENETLKNKVVILSIKVENDKERVAALEKSL